VASKQVTSNGYEQPEPHDENEYRESVHQEISKSETFFYEEHRNPPIYFLAPRYLPRTSLYPGFHPDYPRAEVNICAFPTFPQDRREPLSPELRGAVRRAYTHQIHTKFAEHHCPATERRFWGYLPSIARADDRRAEQANTKQTTPRMVIVVGRASRR
jgi:hypothetical protein